MSQRGFLISFSGCCKFGLSGVFWKKHHCCSERTYFSQSQEWMQREGNVEVFPLYFTGAIPTLAHKTEWKTAAYSPQNGVCETTPTRLFILGPPVALQLPAWPFYCCRRFVLIREEVTGLLMIYHSAIENTSMLRELSEVYGQPRQAWPQWASYPSMVQGLKPCWIKNILKEIHHAHLFNCKVVNNRRWWWMALAGHDYVCALVLQVSCLFRHSTGGVLHLL